MKLDYNSFFVRRYLMSNEYSVPKTFCQLARNTIMMTLMWASLFCLLCLMVYGFFGSLYNFYQLMTTDITWATLMNSEDAKMMFTLFLIDVGGGTGLLIAWGGSELMSYLKNRKRQRESEVYAALQRGEEVEVPKPSRTLEVIRELWTRFHDKTCSIIEYDNHPRDIRDAQRRKEREEWEAELAAQLEALTPKLAPNLS